MDFRCECDHRFKGHAWGSMVSVAGFGLLLIGVYQSGHEILAVVLLTAGSACPGVWQLPATTPGMSLPAS